tara:strand:+ start:522 stop:929 length:408 start_codon:yes stop_codon:yes gene_type:complete
MWAKQYIGIPWVAYATGPDAYDCWGLVVHCLKTHFNIEADRFSGVITDDHKSINRAFESEAGKKQWIEIDEPIEGAVVMLSLKTRFFHHIGIYTNGRVLHSRDGANVSLESISRLKQSGFKQIRYYVHDSILSNS